MSDHLSPERERVIEVLIGPCTREAAEAAAIVVQEALDGYDPKLGAAVGLRYAVSVQRSKDPDSTARRERESINYACPYCVAKPGEPCVNQRNTSEGMRHPHPERLRQVPRV